MGRRGFFADFRFAEDRILVEQVRLLLGNVISNTVPVVLLSLLMTATLSNSTNVDELRLWFGVVVMSKLASFLVARRYRNRPIPPAHGLRLAWSLILSYGINGLAWGTLPWLTMDSASVTGKIITIAVMAGVIGSAMAQTSAVLAVFLTFAATTLSLVAIKLLLLHDPAYSALAAATLLYFASLLSLARNNAAATLAAIQLRFKNAELVEQLRIETEVADNARREAEHANIAKSRFLAAASHDLRQPVHAQGLFLNVLAGTVLDGQQRELVENIRKTSVASAEMLSTLLDFSRIEAGVVRPRYQAFRLQTLLNKIEDELAPLADAKGLIYRSRETRVMVHSDPNLMDLILRNLVSNAIRYTEHGGLLVGCRYRGTEVVLEVWDTGIGIAAEQQEEIFREFCQLGNPERDSRKGLGLGLAIADGLATALGHRLSLASTAQRGSVFRLVLPMVQGVALEHAPPEQYYGGPLGLYVLVIDDDETVREAMRHLLGAWGCECAAADSIEEALVLARRQVPDIVISDYRLREQRTGTEAIAAVRTVLGCDLPALLITGDTALERLREAETGGIPLLHKPVSTRQLYHTMARIVEDAGAASRTVAENA